MKRNKDIYEESLPVFYYQRRELKEGLEEINTNHYYEKRLRLKKEKELDTILDSFFTNISHNK